MLCMATKMFFPHFLSLFPTRKPVNKDQMAQFMKLRQFYLENLPLYSESSLKLNIQLWYLNFCDQHQHIPGPKSVVSSLNLCDSLISFLSRCKYSNTHILYYTHNAK